jgi:glycosyltransferase involved in cell wall biosynthesis
MPRNEKINKADQKQISLITGPGQHVDTIIDTLRKSDFKTQYIKTYPRIVVEYTNSDEKIINSYFHYIQYLTWAAWRRLPFAAKYETPNAVLLPLIDKIASRCIKESDLFIGWSQISLLCMKKAHRLGAKVLLEHQMADVDTWMPLVKEEYSRWGNSKGYHSLFPEMLIRRMRKEREEADYINVLSTYVKTSFLKVGVPESKIITTFFGVNEKKFFPQDIKGNINKRKIRILYVGRLELLKGIPYLLEAFSKIKGKDIELCLVGPVYPEIENALKKFDDKRIKIIGPVPNESLPTYYNKADLFVFPSVNDAFGLVVLEAMSCGLPVITTQNSCANDVIDDGKDGFVIPIQNSQSLQEKIELFLNDRQLCVEMGIEARNKVLTNFTLTQYKNRYLNNIKSTLANQ